MTNSNQQSSAASASRKPRASTTIDRKRVARPVRDGSIISRTSEMVVNRSSSQPQARQISVKQTSQTQSSRPQYSQEAQMSQQQMQQSQQKQQSQTQQQMQTQQMQSQQMQKSQAEMTQQQQMQARRMQVEQIQQQRQRHLMQIATQRMQQRMAAKKEQPVVQKETAQQMKETAIEKALSTASRTRKQERESVRIHFGFKRVLLAMACAAVCVFAIVYFVNLNAPNISLKVAAMQSGIEATYPTFVPREYSISNITSEDGKVTMVFKHSEDEAKGFILVEEKSSWDSNALLNNFVRYEYGDDYTSVREQGLTIYISSSDAAWVNGGIVYKIKAPVNTLTKKQIKSIAVSL
ncbi:hypothetical protein IJ162_03175 [Candidatus Saccharibacteria bacterium]|nr:hypothetical protein [Candidatus Saccharibacteria bacterium]